jgi:hypothetical protein
MARTKKKSDIKISSDNEKICEENYMDKYEGAKWWINIDPSKSKDIERKPTKNHTAYTSKDPIISEKKYLELMDDYMKGAAKKHTIDTSRDPKKVSEKEYLELMEKGNY